MSNAVAIQVPRNLLFRYQFKCYQTSVKRPSFESLGESSQIPLMGTLEGQKSYATLRCGWSPSALTIAVRVVEKQQAIWCRPAQPFESDGIRVWVDTRDTHTVHRATRYCHWFVALPTSGTAKPTPVCGMLKINRAKEDSPTINRAKPEVESKIRADGYDLALRLPAATLNGWDPVEQPAIGFCVAIIDREHGWLTTSLGPDLPIDEDPSLWSSLQLVPGQDPA